jgi:hypothetical protein
MAKMNTIKHLAVGRTRLAGPDEARIERNLFAENGDTFEALRFCKNRNGRHNRVHLVIKEQDFVRLFGDAIENRVFHEKTLAGLRAILAKGRKTSRGRGEKKEQDPFLKVIGICPGDGKLAESINEFLYGEDPA